jgi:hypothetical protein
LSHRFLALNATVENAYDELLERRRQIRQVQDLLPGFPEHG